MRRVGHGDGAASGALAAAATNAGALPKKSQWIHGLSTEQVMVQNNLKIGKRVKMTTTIVEHGPGWSQSATRSIWDPPTKGSNNCQKHRADSC